jgi:uncharacterized membrane protein
MGGVSWNAAGDETVLPPNGNYSAFGVNGDGSIIVGGMDPFYLPVKWTSGGDATPLIVGATWGGASCISANGSVIAGVYQVGAFKLVNGLVYSLYGTGAPQGISADGSIIVGQNSNDAAVWAGGATNSYAQALTTPQGNQFAGMAYAANQNGTVVVGSNTTLGQAFIWKQSTGALSVPSVVSAAPSTLVVATGISSDGKTVVGYSSADGSSNIKAWVAYLP